MIEFKHSISGGAGKFPDHILPSAGSVQVNKDLLTSMGVKIIAYVIEG